MPLDLTLPPPAIVEFRAPQEVRFGLSYAPSRTELDRFIVPRDWREATIEELRAYIPSDLQDMPEWAVRGMFPLFARKVGGGAAPGVRTTVFLTTTNASNQSWSVLNDWNSSENIVHVIGGGGSGGGISPAATGSTGGGGGGAYSRSENIILTPGGSATYRLGPQPALTTGDGNPGADNWFNGTTLEGSSVGAKGGSGGRSLQNGGGGGLGGAAGSGIGSTKYSGGNGAAGPPSSQPGGGGGAAGPDGDGGHASGTTGGTGGNGSGGAGGVNSVGGDGTEFQADPARGSGGGGSHTNTFTSGRTGGNYGGGASGAAASFDITSAALPGAPGLIVIINNHLTGV